MPADLERVVQRCLAKNPADRYQNAGSLEQALAECACANRWTQSQAAQWWLEHQEKNATPRASHAATTEASDPLKLGAR